MNVISRNIRVFLLFLVLITSSLCFISCNCDDCGEPTHLYYAVVNGLDLDIDIIIHARETSMNIPIAARDTSQTWDYLAFGDGNGERIWSGTSFLDHDADSISVVAQKMGNTLRRYRRESSEPFNILFNYTFPSSSDPAKPGYFVLDSVSLLLK